MQTSRRRARVLLSTVGMLGFLAGCSSNEDTPDGSVGAGDAGAQDAAVDAGSVVGCTDISFGDIVLDEQQDVQTIYSAQLSTQLASNISDFLVFNFVNINERFGPMALGSFPLDAAPNDNRATCAECISVFVDQVTPNARPSQTFFQSAGGITVTQDPRQKTFFASIQGLELVEVTIDGSTLLSTPVPNGDCLKVADFTVALKVIPPEWTCTDESYGGDDGCNCTCGAPDPDCFCDPFMDPNCPMDIPDDCPAGSTCTANGCVAGCDMFAVPPVGCGPGELCAFGQDTPICIDDTDRVNTATVGGTCEGLGNLVEYCGVTDTIPTGVCDDIDNLCRPICTGAGGCPAGEICYTIAGGGPGTGSGYCRPDGDIPPPSWTCDPDDYGEGIACHCECGAIDPDCAEGEVMTVGCMPNEMCVAGSCE